MFPSQQFPCRNIYRNLLRIQHSQALKPSRRPSPPPPQEKASQGDRFQYFRPSPDSNTALMRPGRTPLEREPPDSTTDPNRQFLSLAPISRCPVLCSPDTVYNNYGDEINPLQCPTRVRNKRTTQKTQDPASVSALSSRKPPSLLTASLKLLQSEPATPPGLH